jgi:hypothetical protein
MIPASLPITVQKEEVASLRKSLRRRMALRMLLKVQDFWSRSQGASIDISSKSEEISLVGNAEKKKCWE